MTKKQLCDMLQLSAGHPYFQLYKGSVPIEITTLVHKDQIDQEEKDRLMDQLALQKYFASPFHANVYPALDKINTKMAYFSFSDYTLAEIKQVRELCDAFVKFYRTQDRRVYAMDSPRRYAFLTGRCNTVKEKIQNDEDFWLEFWHLDALVAFCIQNYTISVDNAAFEPIRKFLNVMYDYSASTVKEMGNPDLGLYSTCFTEVPYNEVITELYELKKEFLVSPDAAMSKRQKIVVGVQTFKDGVAYKDFYREAVLALFFESKANAKTLRASLLSVFGNILENRGDLSTLLIYDTGLLEDACMLCREVHAVLNNDAIFHEMYLLEKELFIGQQQMREVDPSEVIRQRGGLLRILDCLVDEQIISEDVYLEEVKCLGN